MTLAELVTRAKKKRISIEFNSILSAPDDCVAVRLRRDHLYIDININTNEKHFVLVLSKHVDEFDTRCWYLEREGAKGVGE